jgi:hypothetical protein
VVLSEAISLVQTQGGFDTTSSSSSDTVIRGWINEAVQEAVARAKSRRKSLTSIGPTVAGQSQYAVPAEVVKIKVLRVDGSRPWLRIGTEDLWELEGDNARLGGAPGAYAPENETDADSVVELWPVPDTSGLTIEAHAFVLPDAITAATSTGATIPLPDHIAPRVMGGAIAIGLERVHERADLAQPFRAQFELAVGELSRWANSRVGSGPTRLRVG